MDEIAGDQQQETTAIAWVFLKRSLTLAAALLAAGCGSSGDDDDQVTVMAAASLSGAFDEFADHYETDNADATIVNSFGPSSGLVEQLAAGAQADILATADRETMDDAVSAGVIAGEPTVFAHNALTLIVPDGNPGGVTELADLERGDLRIAVCEPQVPCGRAAAEALRDATVEAAVDTYATDVSDATSRVVLGEADAALVYETDALAAGDDVETIELADPPRNEYLVAPVKDAAHPDAAADVIDELADGIGQNILRNHGFQP